MFSMRRSSALITQRTNAILMLFLALLCEQLTAEIVEFKQVSQPAGILNSVAFVETGATLVTLTAPSSSGSYMFTHWSMRSTGARQQDSVGRSLNPFSFQILEPTEVVANYLPAQQDADNDLIADWFELQFNGDLLRDAAWDGDNDRLTLLEEQKYGLHPRLIDIHLNGGISRRRSPSVTAIFNPDFVSIRERSVPLGISSRDQVVRLGSVFPLITVPTTHGVYRFCGWTFEGKRLDSPLTPSPTFLSVSGPGTAYARFVVATDDLDGDGLADWCEWLFNDSLNFDGGSDRDSDGLLASEELKYSYNPLLRDQLQCGGISRRRSALVDLNVAGYSTLRVTSVPFGIQGTIWTLSNNTIVTLPNLWGHKQGEYRSKSMEMLQQLHIISTKHRTQTRTVYPTTGNIST
jgi:hypothetical protein